MSSLDRKREGVGRMFVAEGTAWAKAQGIVLTGTLWGSSSVLLPGYHSLTQGKLGSPMKSFISTYFFILQYTSLNIFFPIPWNRFTSNEGSNKDNVVFVFFLIFIHWFLVVLGLHCYTWALSSCVEWGLLFVVECGLLIAMASLVELGLQAHGLQ